MPRKNVLDLAGKPLIAHTIDAAKASQLLDRTIVSTDDKEIADVARRLGASVPFMRPDELSQDGTTSYAVLAHSVRWLDENEDYRPDYVMLLQPTSPFRTAQDIDNCIQTALDKDADGVVSLSKSKTHPLWMKYISDDGQISEYEPQKGGPSASYTLRQNLPTIYGVNGAVYLVKREVLVEQNTFYTSRTYAYIMPADRSLDIDTAWDFRIADLVLRDGGLHETD